jgi:hypothetical protein
MSSREPSLPSVIAGAVDARLLAVHTSMPARVESYDKDTQTVSVKPMLRGVVPTDDGEIVESLPVIQNVPVMWPRAGRFFLSFPLAKGDTVLLHFCHSSIDEWRTRGAEVTPADLRKHSLSDAVAYAGLYPNDEALDEVSTEEIVLGEDGGLQLRVGASLIKLGASDGTLDFVALAQKVATELQRIQTYMTLIDTVLRGAVLNVVNGSPDPLWTALQAAITLTPYPAPGSVAASKVKAE